MPKSKKKNLIEEENKEINKGKNLVVNISETLHQQLKVYCAESKKSIKEVVTELIEVKVNCSKNTEERK